MAGLLIDGSCTAARLVALYHRGLAEIGCDWARMGSLAGIRMCVPIVLGGAPGMKENRRVDPEIKALFEVVIEGQRQTDRMVANLATVVEMNSNSTREAINSLTVTVDGLALTVDKYVHAADARMRRIEENLDGLIRAITSEHSNGKHGKG